MSELKISGKVLGVTPYKQITDNFGLEKIYLDTTDNPEYPNMAEFQVVNKKIKCDFDKGVLVEVYFNIQGRKWEKDDRSGFAQNLTAWKILAVAEQTPSVNQPSGVSDNSEVDKLLECSHNLKKVKDRDTLRNMVEHLFNYLK